MTEEATSSSADPEPARQQAVPETLCWSEPREVHEPIRRSSLRAAIASLAVGVPLLLLFVWALDPAVREAMWTRTIAACAAVVVLVAAWQLAEWWRLRHARPVQYELGPDGVRWGRRLQKSLSWDRIRDWQVTQCVGGSSPDRRRILVRPRRPFRDDAPWPFVLPRDPGEQIVHAFDRHLPPSSRRADQIVLRMEFPAGSMLLLLALCIVYAAVVASWLAGHSHPLRDHSSAWLVVAMVLGPGTLWALVPYPRRRHWRHMAFALWLGLVANVLAWGLAAALATLRASAVP